MAKNNDAVSFDVPKSIGKSILTIDRFMGCDFTNSPAAVHEFQSPNCINMIRDVPGKVRKCMGYETLIDFGCNSLDLSQFSVWPSEYEDNISLNNEKTGFNFVGSIDSFASVSISPIEHLDKGDYIIRFEVSQEECDVVVYFDLGNDMLMPVTDGTRVSINDDLVHVVQINYRGGIDTEIKLMMCKVGRKTDVFRPFIGNEVSINGYHVIHGETEGLLHVGNRMYLGEEEVYSEANNARSQSWQFEDNKIVIADGKKLLIFNGTNVVTAESIAYIPKLTISKDPSGGGTEYEALNLLQPGFTELFTGTADATQYHLSFGGLDDTPIKVEVLDNNGTWVEKTLTTDYSVDKTTGIVTFVTAPGVSPITGEDNVKITAYRTVDGYADRINKCKIGIQYGVNGALDRLFLSGNPDYINYDWYSGQFEPTYFPDTGYSKLGSGRSKVIGYSIINSYLAAHKDEMETQQTIILRNGSLVDNKASFRIVNTLQGAGAIAPYSFAYLANEPLFLTRLGIYAVTAQDVTGERYAQNRSFFLNGKMLEEENLEDAYACVFEDMYWLNINDKLYILDGLQPMATDKSMPYSNRQYAAFYRTNVDANCMWVNENRFYFGTSDGKLCRFYNSKGTPASFNDDGEPIVAQWETPDLDGKLFYKNKTFKYMSARLQSAVATSLKLYAMKHGIWSFLKEDGSSARYFAFSKIIFSKFTFSTDTTQRLISTKLRIKKVDSARFRLVNDEVNEPFGLDNLAFEYVENGNFKG